MSQGQEFTQEERSRIIEATLENLRKGLPEYKACVDAGASYPTWFRWREQIPGLTERAKEAKRGRLPLVEDALYKAALSGKVLACLAILEKDDPEWRDRAKELTPKNPVFVFQGGASQMFSMMNPDTRQKFIGALKVAGLLPEGVVIDQPPSEKGVSDGNGAEPNPA